MTRPVLRQRGRTFSPGQTTLYTVHETESFAWDPGDHATEYYWGSTAGPGDPTRHIYNATNEIEGRLVPGGAWEDWADYDPEGNLLKKGQPYSGDLFTLDAWHRVVETRRNTQVLARYEWNASGRLAQKLSTSDPNVPIRDYYWGEGGGGASAGGSVLAHLGEPGRRGLRRGGVGELAQLLPRPRCGGGTR